MRSSTANPCTLDTVRSCVAWLDYVSAALNPERTPHHSCLVHDMHALMRSTAPPPPALQEQWSTQVWAMPGEPYEVYLLRCLARQSGVTLLSPHFSFDSPAVETVDPQMGAAGAQALYAETCVVVGLRVEPTAKNLLQTGWDTQPCPYCPSADPATTAGFHPVLPLLYGGDTCGRCGRAFPMVPAWTRTVYLVLQHGDRTRAAAVAYGDGALRHLSLGASINALLYRSQTEQQEPLLVVHAAQPSVVLSLPAALLTTLNPSSTEASTPTEQRNFFRTFYDQMQSSFAAQKWSGPLRSLDDVARYMAPKLLGQTQAKKVVLLVVMYTLYCSQHFLKDATRRPLHLLLLGPAKTGKSALLCGVQSLMGAQADVLDSTVVRCAGRGEVTRTSDGASFLSALPSRRRDLLMAGPGMTATTLVLDHLPASSSAAVVAPLKDALERQSGCVADMEGLESSVAMGLPVHIIAAAEEESGSAVHLAPFFPLVTSLIPTSSLGESALISQDVVAASRARASTSRSTSRGASTSSSSSITQRSASLMRGPGASALPERLTADDVEYLLRRAADPALLNATMDSAVCYASYMPKLVAAAGLVEEAQPPTCTFLPPPSACRGSRQMDSRLASGAVDESLSASPLCFESHLRVLRCLSQARLLLETAEEVRAVGWTVEMRDEVWQLYEHHLVTLGDLLHQRSGTQRAENARAAAAARAMSATIPGTSDAGAWAPWPSSGGVGRDGNRMGKMSKKKRRLLFVEQLRRCQSLLGDERDVILPAEAAHIYAQMGDSAAFGDLLDVVMSRLQEESLVIRRPGGWRAL
ncbi:hypothetical protein ABB37_03672 [Leptomonas pyrrhocoris]|uniref:MCM domain-containing protein n=1 Tax=Leptomonas pyrrhocoris TaxID=157538 RepID=A0A0N1J4W9_LEPPY|nr:hypothetical protein ABB37_03672 [Leptomonas pyrrhocoris]XP_015659697.1 hypothetical protein ABB37_03672 [Leptomonas pyrrhocoris]KPA81257.1 hypothetical protein ABB37_03672 [Leptomonas pyrrhocoris]KPA81258.1 hypothetical protein ABB37_03672 [Leptomonas pyrrhocoris]|eukprot:XP_015659696.1 hypothetical protein ABB37_03672 [Leptomonas pyrrhocoris]